MKDDVISRQAAIDILDAYQVMVENGEEKPYEWARLRMSELPSVQPKPHYDEWCATCKEYDQEKHCCPRWNKVIRRTVTDMKNAKPHWIQCSETVDIPDHEILACDKYGEEMFGYLAYEDDQWLCASDDCMMYDPIAWREKPEPYREGEQNGKGT